MTRITGIVKNLHPKPEQEAIRPAKRRCLRCTHEFNSAGIHRRLCNSCKYVIKKDGLTSALDADIGVCHAKYDLTIAISDLPLV